MKHRWPLPDGREVDLDYFVNWRPYLWRDPIARALRFLGNLRGKRILEIGGNDGRMTSLFALLGADVAMLDTVDLGPSVAEVAQWGVGDRVRLIRTDGGFNEVRGETFDAVFTKSVLWGVERLAEFLDQIEAHLADGGKVAFVENVRGGRLEFWLRRNIIHRGRFDWEDHYYGITPSQIDLFRERFADLNVRRHRHFVYEIFGRKGFRRKVDLLIREFTFGPIRDVVAPLLAELDRD